MDIFNIIIFVFIHKINIQLFVPIKTVHIYKEIPYVLAFHFNEHTLYKFVHLNFYIY